LPSARPSPTVLKASPRASYACRMRRGVQLHLAGCSALRIGRRPRAAVTTLVAGKTTNLMSGQSCDLHPTPATNLSSILGYNHWGGTSPLHHPYTLACILIGAQQHRPFSSFTSLPSTPIFDKTSHLPGHTPNSFTFQRVETPLTQSPSRVQTQTTNSLSRAQVRFAPQGFWSSGPRAFSHPGFCGLILYIVHYPIPGLYLTPSRIFGFTLQILSDTTQPRICSYHVRGSIFF